MPVFFGQAEQDFGVCPLLAAISAETPAPRITAQRRGLTPNSEGKTLVQVLKNYYIPQGGRLSLVRVWQGQLQDEAILNGNQRASGIYRLFGQQQEALPAAAMVEIVAVGRLESAKTGDTLTTASELTASLPKADPIAPVYALAIAPEK
ncbi:MAG: hypothetical protein HC890_05485 [Chloroflexaceae bacterium]|nr:hypothetical protein [Chloroflexaceae bacterium]